MCIQSTRLLNTLEMVTISTVENKGNHNHEAADDDDVKLSSLSIFSPSLLTDDSFSRWAGG